MLIKHTLRITVFSKTKKNLVKRMAPFNISANLLQMCVLGHVQLFATPWTVAH